MTHPSLGGQYTVVCWWSLLSLLWTHQRWPLSLRPGSVLVSKTHWEASAHRSIVSTSLLQALAQRAPGLLLSVLLTTDKRLYGGEWSRWEGRGVKGGNACSPLLEPNLAGRRPVFLWNKCRHEKANLHNTVCVELFCHHWGLSSHHLPQISIHKLLLISPPLPMAFRCSLWHVLKFATVDNTWSDNFLTLGTCSVTEWYTLLL